MESILIHPESTEQTLPAHVLKDVEEGIRQYENGQTISFNEFIERHFTKP
jgi:hypothetical protein